ncbi:NAD(P)H-quinone oxidoreductase [Leptolyngbya sp. 7M]|uniref:NAD(P)H-quinone oxidoreductase n=1 Tax=Leptolyngbya sp. 7M TaxID=2812896 RepID=UPI001B8AD4B3|nr:NAD(P)H-quinone oxidoreductase [Leptolyngbya sp. 7M]QYO66318.1 NAD(P)H-quinone oxidoreductase [Leptolyngbya sp. 7M]
MRTVYINEFGGPENLAVRNVPEPYPPQGREILVQVAYAGINRADVLQRKGLYPPPAGFDPRRPGLEFAGSVVECGGNVTSFRPGDFVCGITSGEAQSEFIAIDERLAINAAELTQEAAAAIPEAYITAHDALITQAKAVVGDFILIHAIASGVGLAAAELALSVGCQVIGTTRSEQKAEALTGVGGPFYEKGVGILVLKDGPAFSDRLHEMTNGRGADVVIDLVGGDYFPDDLLSAASKGRIMLIGLTAGRRAEFDMGIALSKRLTIRGTVLRSRSIEEKALALDSFRHQMLQKFSSDPPQLRPFIDKVFALEDVAEAHRYIEGDHNIGKVLLKL